MDRQIIKHVHTSLYSWYSFICYMYFLVITDLIFALHTVRSLIKYLSMHKYIFYRKQVDIYCCLLLKLFIFIEIYVNV